MQRKILQLTQNIELQRGGEPSQPLRVKRVITETHCRKESDHLIFTLFLEEKLHVFQLRHVAGIQANPVLPHCPQAALRPLRLILREWYLSLDRCGHICKSPCCNRIPAGQLNKFIGTAALIIKHLYLLQSADKRTNGCRCQPFTPGACYTGPAQAIADSDTVYRFIDDGNKLNK